MGIRRDFRYLKSSGEVKYHQVSNFVNKPCLIKELVASSSPKSDNIIQAGHVLKWFFQW